MSFAQTMKEKASLAAISFGSFEKIHIHEGIILLGLPKLELTGVNRVLSLNFRKLFYPIL